MALPKQAIRRRLGQEPDQAATEGSSGQEQPSRKHAHAVRCSEGHEMNAKLTREMLQLIRCDEAQYCDQCERELSDHVAYYRCKACDENHCLTCARTQLGLCAAAAPPANANGYPTLQLGPGDILLVGPDKYNIHHVVLVRGPLEPVPELADLTGTPPGAELFACATIESTQGSTGVNTWWYATHTVLERDPHDEGGAVSVVADLPQDGSDSICLTPEPVPVKVLLHPLRGSDAQGHELDAEVFEEVLSQAAERSQRYSWKTAVKAFLAYQTTMHEAEYPTKQDRAVLLEQIYASWTKPPICSAVAIQVWQQYLVAMYHDDPDAAAQAILSVMPLWCHMTTPSAMVKELTHNGWELLESLDA